MDLSNAESEPYVRFRRLRAEFDRNIRVAYGGLQELRTASLAEGGGFQSVPVPSGEEPWGKTRNWKNVPDLTARSARFLAQMGLVHVMSAFEEFLGDIKTEHDRFAIASGNLPEQPDDEDADEQTINRLCGSLGWSPRPIAPIAPLFEYFTIARNCIVHRSGRASRALVRISGDALFLEAAANWTGESGRPLPAFPQIELNREITFLPRHAVLASIVCNRLAHHFDRRLVDYLGEIGAIYMAAFHALLSDDRPQYFKARSADIVVRRALCERYRVKGVHLPEVIAALKGLDKWRSCYRRHQVLAA